MTLNKAMLIGRLTRDPEMRYTPSGAAVTNFSIATNRYGTDAAGEKKEYTDFHNIVAWNIGRRNLAELCAQFLRKGSLVYVEGRLQTRSWEGQDGAKKSRTEINVTDVEFLESRRDAAAAEGGGGGFGAPPSDEEFAATPGAAPRPATAAAPAAAETQDIDPDDIPF
ncbi:MAG: single-strand DNA-binding protein [Chloroflexota bacterium]|nr:single-strand DNA-binding protein [Chloroflexota bacterium]